MTDRTKLILAITLGSLGLVIGIVAAITAFNAKSEADSDQDVISTVDQRFAEAQAKQDKLEKKQASDAETLVNSLTGKERSLVRQLNKQSKQIKNLQQKTRNNANSVDTLSSREREQSNEISNVENQQQSDVNSLNRKINNLTQRVNRLSKKVNSFAN
jgi:chromosome segregation ATPase